MPFALTGCASRVRRLGFIAPGQLEPRAASCRAPRSRLHSTVGSMACMRPEGARALPAEPREAACSLRILCGDSQDFSLLSIEMETQRPQSVCGRRFRNGARQTRMLFCERALSSHGKRKHVQGSLLTSARLAARIARNHRADQLSPYPNVTCRAAAAR
jgi:hypothetical protein